MYQYKVCVYAITKNEQQFVDRWMDAVSEADQVVVLDTGSTDQTVEKLKARGAFVYQEIIQPWRFDVARNCAMDHIPEEIDICVSNDLDEVFEPGWRAKLEAAWNESATRARYQFVWQRTDDGAVVKQFMMEKIHARQGFRWVHPVHEVLAYTGSKPDFSVWVPELRLHHYPDTSKARSQYLPLLELSAAENPQDDRVMFWLGREYMYYAQWEKCIETLQKHLQLPSALWKEERCASMRFIGRSYLEMRQYPEAKKWYWLALAECPIAREPYYHMAIWAYMQHDWPLLVFMAEEALKITEKTGSYLLEPICWGSFFYDYGAIAYARMGLLEKAESWGAIALALEPENERIKNNLTIYKKMREEEKQC